MRKGYLFPDDLVLHVDKPKAFTKKTPRTDK